MASKVTLVITEGPYQGKQFLFEEKKMVRFGRASDCDVRFEDDRRMSRYHCELVVDPPQVQIYDLGSLHGTVVNGVKYGGRTERKVKKAVAKRQHSPIELEDGAEIRVGRNVIQVEIELDQTFELDQTEGATLLDDELDATLLIDNYSARNRSPAVKPRVQRPRPTPQSVAQREKTVVEARSRVPDANKTVVERSSAQAPDSQNAKTIVDAPASRRSSAHQSKTVVDASARQTGPQPQIRTVLGSRLRVPTDDLGQRLAQRRQASVPAYHSDKTVVERGSSRLSAAEADKTVVERRSSRSPADDLDKTVVERRPSRLSAAEADKTVVERRPSRLSAANADKTVVERRPSRSPADNLDKTVVVPAKSRRPAAKPLDQTVVARPPSQKSGVASPPAPVRSVLTPEQQEARSALLEILKDLGIKALNQDRKLAAYVIEKRLGRGGFGKVFQARHRTTQERAAIKIMRPRAAVNEYVRQSFKREIDNTRTLFHSNIVQLLDDGSVGNMFYFMMEFCNAGNANQLRRKRGGKIPLAEAIPIMKQILQGLSFIHERGYVHRDLKPDNILLTNTPNGVVAKIADLGLTKGFLETGMDGGITITGTRIGTGPYMSREQLTNFKYIEPVSDVWSIGATFYMMLTGKPPRQGPPNLKNYDLILKGRIIPIQQFEPSIPFAIARIIDRALVVDTKKRYETATEMLNALERVTQSK